MLYANDMVVVEKGARGMFSKGQRALVTSIEVDPSDRNSAIVRLQFSDGKTYTFHTHHVNRLGDPTPRLTRWGKTIEVSLWRKSDSPLPHLVVERAKMAEERIAKALSKLV